MPGMRRRSTLRSVGEEVNSSSSQSVATDAPENMSTDEQQPDADRSTPSPEPRPAAPARAPTNATSASAARKPPPKPNLMTRLGLDVPTVMMMFKGSLPPIIGISIYQSTPVAQYFTTLGYLVPIISVLALAILPRGKYLQNLVLNVSGICIGAAISMLALWTGVRARHNTATAEELATGLPIYNSSQSAVCGIWLFFNIWISNTLRAKYPAMNLPVMIYSIFMNVACTFGPLMVTDASAESFVRRLLVAMLSAMGIATGVALFIFPVSSRKVVSAEFKGAIGLVRKSIRLQLNYLQVLSSDDMLEREPTRASSAFRKKPKGPEMTKEARAAGELKGTALAISALFGKMHGDMVFAKRDIAYGKLDAKDMSEIFNRLRSIMIPLNGISTIVDIFRRAAEKHGWGTSDEGGDTDVEKSLEQKVWNDIMLQLYEPFEILTEAMDQGLEHVGIVLELAPKPKKSKTADVEMEAGAKALPKPGESGFAQVLADKVQDFNDKKGEMLKAWLKERREATELERQELHLKRLETRMKERDQTQLYVMLYMEKLMLALGEAVQDLVMFADSKVADGTMGKKRLIIPSQRRIMKWLRGACSTQDGTPEQNPDMADMGANVVYAGDGYNKKKDPEHLPAHGAWQHFGNRLRKISAFVGSGESMFGFRVAVATMTVGILAFLKDTQTFFNEQRLVWAMIMIAIGMTITAGQSIFGFVCRVGGTLVAMIFSYIIWYIVVERTAGVIVFLWLFTFIEQYFVLKYPRFMPVWLIMIITQVLIIGYELQVQKIGEVAAAATGQPYYPTYLLAPYRLACVAAGCAIAFIWTVFPSPITDRRWLRMDLSASLYLLANYFSVITETIKATMNDTHGDIKMPGTPAQKMEKERRRILGKLLLLLPSLDSHAQWQKWEPDIGGKFPRATYEDIIRRSTSIMRYLTLIAYTITWKPRDRPSTASSASDRQWLRALNQVLAGIEPTQHTILSTLALLSNSLLSGQSLPPFMQLPRPNELTRKLLHLRAPEPEPQPGIQRRGSELEHRLVTVHTHTGEEVRSTTRKPSVTSDNSTLAGMAELAETISPPGSGSILDVKNVEQHGYTEFAVLQVCSSLVCDDLEGLVRAVSSLVGVVDFSFRVNGSEATLSSSEEDDVTGKAKRH
ncbi:MFS transporter protein [Colletotrichum asianum]